MIRPLGYRVVIQVAEAETKTASGIILADTAKEKPMKGVVVAVGPGEFKDGQRSPMDVKVGDAVIYSKYAGTEVKVDGEDYLVCRQSDILAIAE